MVQNDAHTQLRPYSYSYFRLLMTLSLLLLRLGNYSSYWTALLLFVM